ncbi:MAG: hypothetical protein ISS70_01235 [Phycisphaerae bacterium]|jgi:hypothetical protein|nr:hypothetical protein [Phycisphaerae bacterium]
MAIFGHRKAKLTPDEIAGVFLSEFVANDDLAPSNELDLSPEQQQQYASKCKLYRLALVIMTLMNEERNNPKVLLVRESIESKVFCLPDDQSHALLSQIQSSMSDLQKLLLPDGNPKELSWARSWFESIHIDAINPVDLTLFASSWMDQYIAATKSLRDFKIV